MKKPMFSPTAEIMIFSAQDILTSSTEKDDPEPTSGIVLPDDEL